MHNALNASQPKAGRRLYASPAWATEIAVALHDPRAIGLALELEMLLPPHSTSRNPTLPPRSRSSPPASPAVTGMLSVQTSTVTSGRACRFCHQAAVYVAFGGGEPIGARRAASISAC